MLFLIDIMLFTDKKKEMQLTHLLFANDNLVFCSDSRDQLAYINWILLWFEAISGLKMNLDKSSILPVEDVENLEALAAELGCRTGTFPSTYLNLPFGMRRNSL